MASLNESILKLRSRAFYLFLLPTLALVGSLVVSNYIVEFDYKPDYYSYYQNQSKEYLCNKDNSYCRQYELFTPSKISKLDNCGKSNTDIIISFKKENFFGHNNYNNISNKLNDNNLDEEFNLFFKTSNKKNQECIKNSNLYLLYKIYHSPFEKLYKFKSSKDYEAATSNAIFPFFYGESSISNIVKRFPINFIFKPLIYIGCIFMILFWYSYNHVVNQISSSNKYNNFLIFGYLSCVFLFLHVLLLGVEIDNKIFKLSRKIIIVSFILFEVIAQYTLLKKIYSLKNTITILINEIFLKLKILLVGFVIVATIFIVLILIIYDLNKKFDYILEWNYFLILLFYYLFSFFMWKKEFKKLPSYPTTS